MQPVRIATVPYVNAAPLTWAFAEGRDPAFDIVAEPPARIADLLEGGRVDVGLLPAIELQRLAGMEILPGLCIASRRRARSVYLASRKPIGQVRRIALDRSSRTSAALLRIILAHRRVTGVSFTESDPSLPDMLREHDAALLIGDAALKADTTGLERYDLAEEWSRMTGLPFVFALWAVPSQTALPRGARPFIESFRAGRARIPEIARREAERTGLAPEAIEEYLMVNMHYELGEEEERALDLFFLRAHDLGLISAPRPLTIRPDAEAESSSPSRAAS